MTPPDDDEMAAIVAAVDLLWPRPVAASPRSAEPNRWRFSGRWWARPAASRPVRRR